MPNPTPPRVRQIGLVLIFVCFLTSAEAQHGGGHSAGGHFGGGHSSGRHTGSRHTGGKPISGRTGGRHFGWLHFWSGRQAGRPREANIAEGSRQLPTELAKGATPVRALPPPHLRPIPLAWFPVAGGFLFSSEFRHPRGCFFGRFPRFHSSGCFFNGFTQVCFFEPALPLFFFSAGVDPFLSPPTLDGSSLNTADDLNVPNLEQSRIDADVATAGPVEADTSKGDNSGNVTVAAVDSARASAAQPGQRFFLLILKNGTRRPVTNYWLADGYIEYVSDDSARSHIPLEALDLEKTVIENSGRGLTFVLRSGPEDTH